MTSKLTQRIIGIVVLIAIGIIVVPFFMSKEKGSEYTVKTTEIPIQPPQPEFEMAQTNLDSDISVAEEDANNSASSYETTGIHSTDEVNVEENALNSTKSNEMEETAADNTVSEITAAQATATSEKTAPAPSPTTTPLTPPQPVSKAATSPAKKPATVSKPATAVSGKKQPTTKVAPAPSLDSMKPIPGTAWIVQLASFSKEANAKALQNKLRAQGFTAYIQQAKTSSGIVNRVFVGPFVARHTAEGMLVQINKKLGLQGLVVNYNPVNQ